MEHSGSPPTNPAFMAHTSAASAPWRLSRAADGMLQIQNLSQDTENLSALTTTLGNAAMFTQCAMSVVGNLPGPLKGRHPLSTLWWADTWLWACSCEQKDNCSTLI